MKLAAIFSKHLVLQRDKEIYIFGETNKDEAISIEIDDISVKADIKCGKWEIKLPSHRAGGPFTLSVRGESENTVIEDVLYGDVWLANGQSNIEFELGNSRGGKELLDTENNKIRYFLRKVKFL